LLHEESLKEFEKIALLMQNNCLDRHEDQCLKANYEIRSMIIIQLPGASLLCYGDKSGSFRIVNRETDKEICIREHAGVIDSLDYKILPGNRVLLFAVVRYKGIYPFFLFPYRYKAGPYDHSFRSVGRPGQWTIPGAGE
jgi:hypothetical protein